MQLDRTWRLLLLVVALRLAADVYANEVEIKRTSRRLTKRVCTFEGYYAVPGATTTQPCPGTMPCPPASYCTDGVRRPCPAGVYGDEEALRTKQCSAPCPEGFFCPEGTAFPIECGSADVYCPVGSAGPITVPRGFYALGGEATGRRRSAIKACGPGSFCVSGRSQQCPAGTYGATAKLETPKCSAQCPVGHYCPKASILPIPCPAGTYGATSGLTDNNCSGICPIGYACPEGTTSATTWPCKHDTFCPTGSASPRAPRRGMHLVKAPFTMEVTCPIGSFCSPNEAPGSIRLCPGGTFGNVTGLSSATCSGLCQAGYYCPRGSTSATQVVCGDVSVYCPLGSAFPTQVTLGYYTVGRTEDSITTDKVIAEGAKDRHTRVAQRRCEPGTYCVNGERFSCPAGTFGNKVGLTTHECSGLCTAGYYCPKGSIVAQAVACSTSTVYCPQGSTFPIPTDKGYCAIANETARWYDQRKAKPGEFAWRGTCYPCPAGHYGSNEMETRPMCSDLCAAGYFCPSGSTTPTQEECGSAAVFCPVGSALPQDVRQGYYTSLHVRAIIPGTLQAPGCEPGKYRDDPTTVNAFVDAANPITVNYGDFSFPVAPCVACPNGTFKSEAGDALALCEPCPQYTTVSSSDRRSCSCFRLAGGESFNSSTFALHFNKVTRTCEVIPRALIDIVGDGGAGNNSIYTRSEQFPCERGYFCLDGVRSPCPAGSYGNESLETRPTCSGACSRGFYCPLGSWNSTARACRDANVFCPSGSAVPTPVLSGYYSVSLLLSTTEQNVHDGQRLCDPGAFCIDGKKMLCPAGYYGKRQGETSQLCTGLCTRGYYCPEGSLSPTQHECGGNNVICPTGSAKPQRVQRGYYSIGITNTTRYFQKPCEPGYFCIDGIKYQCPAGTHGATSGLSSPVCSGKCAPGYYCPSHPNPPSVTRTPNECGNSTVYCPEGTGNEPRFVLSGYYSVMTTGMIDDGRNATQNDIKICPRGFYCRRGIRIRCPAGTYGDVEGLSTTSCSGWCPAGFFCPVSTSDYRLNSCPPGTSSTKGAAVCV